MGTVRLLRCGSNYALNFLGSDSSNYAFRCSTLAKGLGFNGDNQKKIKREFNNSVGGEIRKLQMAANSDHLKPSLSSSAAQAVATSSGSLISTEPKQQLAIIERGILDLVSSFYNNINVVLILFRKSLKPTSLNQQVQMLIEKTIIDCRFFTLFAVAGSLLASVLCFVEGCFIVVKTYIHYLHTLSQKTDQGHVMQLLIEAMDTFLLGTAMLIFGFGLYTLFVGSKSVKEKGPWLAGSNLFGLFYMKKLPTWVEMQSVSHAKSKMGHAVMMILQVGVLEKFKSVPLVTGTDLACFAGAVLMSSASIFLLSKLSLNTTVQDR